MTAAAAATNLSVKLAHTTTCIVVATWATCSHHSGQLQFPIALYQWVERHWVEQSSDWPSYDIIMRRECACGSTLQQEGPCLDHGT